MIVHRRSSTLTLWLEPSITLEPQNNQNTMYIELAD